MRILKGNVDGIHIKIYGYCRSLKLQLLDESTSSTPACSHSFPVSSMIAAMEKKAINSSSRQQ